MKNVLWFSRHSMSEDQQSDLERIYGEVTINQISETIQSAYEIKEAIEASDVVAIVAPIGLQQQFLKIAGGKPVIMSKTRRVFDETGEKISFAFDGWYQLVSITIETKDL